MAAVFVEYKFGLLRRDEWVVGEDARQGSAENKLLYSRRVLNSCKSGFAQIVVVDVVVGRRRIIHKCCVCRLSIDFAAAASLSLSLSRVRARPASISLSVCALYVEDAPRIPIIIGRLVSRAVSSPIRLDLYSIFTLRTQQFPPNNYLKTRFRRNRFNFYVILKLTARV